MFDHGTMLLTQIYLCRWVFFANMMLIFFVIIYNGRQYDIDILCVIYNVRCVPKKNIVKTPVIELLCSCTIYREVSYPDNGFQCGLMLSGNGVMLISGYCEVGGKGLLSGRRWLIHLLVTRWPSHRGIHYSRFLFRFIVSITSCWIP